MSKPKHVITACKHVILVCSNCRAGLMDILESSPNAIDPVTKKPFEWKVQCNCPFCGDKSPVKNVVGLMHPGGYGIPKEDDEDEVIASTIFTGNFETRDGGLTIIFETMKVSPHAEPQKVFS